MAAFGECATGLRTRWLKLLGNVNISEIILIVKIVNSEPLDLCHLLTIWQCQGKVLIVIAIQNIGSSEDKESVLVYKKEKEGLSFSNYSLAILIGYYETLWSGPITSTRPKERICSISIVVKAHDQKSILVDGIDIARYLMMVGIQLAQVLSSIGSIFILILGNLSN